jgi:hypothetical protein
MKPTISQYWDLACFNCPIGSGDHSSPLMKNLLANSKEVSLLNVFVKLISIPSDSMISL